MTTNVLSYSSTNVSTSAYVTLISSLSTSASKLMITDSSGQLLKLALGAAGHEVDICSVPVSGTIIVPIFIQPGQRLSIKAISNTASSGFNVVSLLE